LIYDFYGFPDEMYQYKWAAPEDPKLARRLVDMLNKANIETHFNEKRGIDHGSWVPLALMYPDADVPVVQVALHRQLSIKHHIEIGKALRPLIDDGILIIGSGGSTHNLRKLNWENFYGSSDKWVDNWETSLKEVIELEDLEEREKKLAGIVHHVCIALRGRE
jgi:4,5-DOPA dioxygenase extradiol